MFPRNDFRVTTTLSRQTDRLMHDTIDSRPQYHLSRDGREPRASSTRTSRA